MVGPLRNPRLRAAGLVLPLVAFIAVTFVAPVATMLVRSVYDPVVADALPETLMRCAVGRRERAAGSGVRCRGA